jgi:UDP-N-acetyl-D-galactosamine dehydrogenase
MNKMKLNDLKLAVIGLGYVGLPLAVEFGKSRSVIAYDINKKRISKLKKGIDETLEVTFDELKTSSLIRFTSNLKDLASCNCFIVTVPTPIDESNSPDLSPLQNACKDIGSILSKRSIIIFESTVYPGVTEEVCVPIIEEISNLKFNKDFYCGYSPERINPGDKGHRINSIKKITSGSTPQIAKLVDQLYKEIILAGTHIAESIKVAEAAKVIENTQRDLNIALMNELSIIFSFMGIDTNQVLAAAETKWNFLPFKPGLVGGHCIGVDPYYLTYKAQSLGYNPEIILAGRGLNDQMPKYIVSQFIKLMIRKKIQVFESRVLVMGLTFKENCPDIRNSKVIDLIDELEEFNCNIDVFDPWVSEESQLQIPKLKFVKKLKAKHYDGIILAVAHNQFITLGAGYLKKLAKRYSVIMDLKGIFPKKDSDFRL